MPEQMKIAIIGAGLSGITAARTLKTRLGAAVDITIFEKSRGAGGRMSTRRTDAFEFDHGAQYFTARHPNFVKAVEIAVKDSHVTPWNGPAKYLKNGAFEDDTGGQRYVSAPRMNSWVKAMSAGLTIVTRAKVSALDRGVSGQWSLRMEDGDSAAKFDRVILAIPALQALALLEPTGFSELDALKTVRMEPCFAVMVGLEDKIDVPWETLRQEDGPVSWIAVNSAKPGRPDTGATLMIHAGPNWSAEHVEADKADIQEIMLRAASATIGVDLSSAAYVTIHRWLYASVSQGVGQDCLTDPTLGITVCGDWCLGGRVEGAYLSGMAAGENTS